VTPEGRRLPGWTLAAVAFTAGAERFWRARDGRLPNADGGALAWVPDLYWALGTRPATLAAAQETLFAPGGWYAWLVAGALRAFGRAPGVFDAASGAGWIAAVVSAALLARAANAPVSAADAARSARADRAGAVAALLLAATPWLTLTARGGDPRPAGAALAGLTLLVAARDPGLARVGSILAASLFGAALLALEPSASMWLAPALLLFAAGVWSRGDGQVGPFVGKLSAIAAFWGAGALVGMAEGASAAVPAHPEGAAGALRDAVARIVTLLERPALVALLLAAIAGIVLAVTRPRTARPVPLPWRARLRAAATGLSVRPVLVLWALTPLLDAAIHGGKPDTLLPAALALAVLAAGPLSAHVGGVVVVAGAFAAFTFPQYEAPSDGGLSARLVPSLAAAPAGDTPFRPVRGDIVGTLGALLDATCASEAWASCAIIVDQGLVAPDSDDLGRLARFLLAEDRVALASVYDAPRSRAADRRIDALLTWDCGERDDRWRLRAPDATTRVVELAAARGLAPAWSGRLGDPGCGAYWLTPGGRVANAGQLPAFGEGVPSWTPLFALARVTEFYRRHPSHRERQGRGSAAHSGPGGGWAAATEAPPGWSADAAAASRARARE